MLSRPSHRIHFINQCDAKYKTLVLVGRGTHGRVYKGYDVHSLEIVAIKLLQNPTKRQEKECNILRYMKHENIIRFIDGCITTGPFSGITLHVVMEFCPHDLCSILRSELVINEGEVKMLCLQLLRGINYMHNNCVVHRDIKPDNLLLSINGVLKIADFGAAMTFGKKRITDTERMGHSLECGAFRYRAPEMLLGDCWYGTGVDIWSYGLICMQFFTRLPMSKIFNCSSGEQSQLKSIIELFGTIDKESYPKAEGLQFFPLVNTMGIMRPRRLKQYLKELGVKDDGVEFVDSILVLDPDKRPDAQSLLDHSYLKSNPEPACLQQLANNISIITAKDEE